MRGARQIVGARSRRPSDRDRDRDGTVPTTFVNQLSRAADYHAVN